MPFLNLVRPFQVMREVWAGSSYLAGRDDAESWWAIPTSPRVGWWWGLFLGSWFLGNVAFRRMYRAEEVGEMLTAGWALLASDVFEIPATLVAWFLVREVTELQERARTRAQVFD